MTEEAAPPNKPKPQPSNRATPFLVVVVIAATGWAVLEFRQSQQLSTELANANSRVLQMEKHVAILSQQLEKSAAKLNELTKRTLPVSVIFRPSTYGAGLMTIFKNNAPTLIDIGVVLTNPTTNRRREANLSIAPNGVQSIGEAEGWIFAPGHRIQVTHAQFGTVEYVVPN